MLRVRGGREKSLDERWFVYANGMNQYNYEKGWRYEEGQQQQDHE